MTPTPSRRSSNRCSTPLALAALLVAGTAFPTPSGIGTTPLVAQVAGSTAANTPEQAVADFSAAFSSYAWEAFVQRLHPEAHALLRLSVDILVEYDESGWFLRELANEETLDAYRAVSDPEIVLRALRWIHGHAPGLLSSWSGRATEVLGVVAEGEDRHVLYRTIQLVQGAEPELRVLTATRVGEMWRVRAGQDLRTLHSAIRGIPLPPPGSGISVPRPPAR